MDSDISMIGLGAMGTALAGALLKSGRKVTVWNRSPDKMAPLVAKGAIGAESLASAIGASPHSMICLMNYSATNNLFTDPNVAAATGDKSVVQLGTSTPEESEEAQALFGRLGAEYLDGTIMCWPGNIGTSTARIAVAGSRVAFSSCEKDLRILAEACATWAPTCARPRPLSSHFFRGSWGWSSDRSMARWSVKPKVFRFPSSRLSCHRETARFH